MATTPPTPPASTDPRDAAFIREVDEAYRSDELGRLARRYGRWVLLAVGLVLAGVAAFLFWRGEQQKRLEATSLAFSQALTKADEGATTEAVTALGAVVDSGKPTYGALARMAQAGIASGGGDAATAAKQLEAVAADAAAPEAIRDAATLKLVRLQFDTMPPAEVLKRTAPFIAGDNPWFPIAGEMAALAHLKAGEPEKAAPLFLRIAGDRRAPESLRGRAEQMAAALGQDVSGIAEKLRQPAPAGPEAIAAEAAAK